VEVSAADPGGDADTDRESEYGANCSQRGGLGGEESVDQSSDAPSAFMMAKSRRRSKTQPISVASTQSAAVSTINGTRRRV